ncbi:hypothetical protein [Oscillibacter sp.]|uniref:hypothetical protein n=1 Tax=Oscillibacter sp. TaxID=1945593 RepID=UPI002899CD14|nr:hypothetical protein [Oscillibacter sp.]
MQYIINQDRDLMIEKSDLFIKPKYRKGILLGFNLYCKAGFFSKVLLGTFDSLKEAEAEKDRVNASEDGYILVDGYEPSCEDDGPAWVFNGPSIRCLRPEEPLGPITEALND